MITRISIVDGRLTKENLTMLPTFDEQCDCLVAGLGAGGTYAAIAAAREGASVIAVERENLFGGMPTIGRVPTYYYGGTGGTFEEYDARNHPYADLFAEGEKAPVLRVIKYAEAFSRYGVRIHLQSIVFALYFEDNRAVGADILTPEGEKRISFHIAIDGTSDGHLIRLSGAKMLFGRSGDGMAAPFSTVVQNYDEKSSSRSTDFKDSGTVNPFLQAEYCRKILASRAQKAKPRYEKGMSFGAASLPGLREGLRFVGEDTLTYRDIINRKTYEKTLLYGYSDLDKHGHDLAIDEEDYQNFWVICNLATVAIRFAVPMGAAVPKGLTGIISASRTFSIDSYASATFRMNRDMFRLGECVGILSALSVRYDGDVMSVPYADYLERVMQYRCFEGNPAKDFGFDFPNPKKGTYTAFPLHFSKDGFLEKLASDTPGAALFTAYRCPDKWRDVLKEAVADKESARLRENAAIGLGLLGEKASLPFLRHIVKNRSSFYFKDCRRSNQFPSAIALCLLGRIGEKEDEDLLDKIILDPAEFERNCYHELAPDYLFCNYKNCNFVFYTHYTHAVMARVKLALKYGDSDKLFPKLEKRFSGEGFEVLTKQIANEPENGTFRHSFVDFTKQALRICREGIGVENFV